MTTSFPEWAWSKSLSWVGDQGVLRAFCQLTSWFQGCCFSVSSAFLFTAKTLRSRWQRAADSCFFRRSPEIGDRDHGNNSPPYCWWLKSCTTKDDDYPIICRVLTIPGGAGFQPSTVVIMDENVMRIFFWPEGWSTNEAAWRNPQGGSRGARKAHGGANSTVQVTSRKH